MNVNFHDGKMHPMDSTDISFQEFGHYEELPAELEKNVIDSAKKARSNH